MNVVGERGSIGASAGVHGEGSIFRDAQSPPINGMTATEGGGVQEVITYLQQVHTVRLHTVHSLTYSLFHDWPGDLCRPEYAPFCCSNDVDRRLDVFDSSTLDKRKSKDGRKEGKVRLEATLNVNPKCFRRGCNALLSQT